MEYANDSETNFYLDDLGEITRNWTEKEKELLTTYTREAEKFLPVIATDLDKLNRGAAVKEGLMQDQVTVSVTQPGWLVWS